MDEKKGVVQTYEYVYEPLRQFGVPASVWDEVFDEAFQPGFCSQI